MTVVQNTFIWDFIRTLLRAISLLNVNALAEQTLVTVTFLSLVCSPGDWPVSSVLEPLTLLHLRR